MALGGTNEDIFRYFKNVSVSLGIGGTLLLILLIKMVSWTIKFILLLLFSKKTPLEDE